jgi:hypothetical protein
VLGLRLSVLLGGVFIVKICSDTPEFLWLN